MTRFARAKGSKSSNVKTAEDGTPWEVMKEQMQKTKKEEEETKKREEAEKQRIENYNSFLKDHKTQKRNATWCEFPQAKEIKKTKTEAKIVSKGKSEEKTRDVKKTDKKKMKQNEDNENKQSTKNGVSSNQNNIEDDHSIVDNKLKKKKVKKNHTDTNIDNNNTEDLSQKDNSTNNSGLKRKNKKKTQQNRRKAINDKSFQLIINGKEIELVRFDGFPIIKKDAERLQELKNNMIKKGIPKSEVQRNIKLERRRAEKALARIKREVCYNCRKGGHNLSDCPDLKSNIPGKEIAEGVCFKCGSTEHRQFECKVQRDKEFRFATCFICKESGHIARQCPDNPKGLYPNGGCCKLCGDVTHLKKDCHMLKDKKEETTIKLPTLSDNTVEDIDMQQVSSKQPETQKKPKKVKF